MAAEAEATAAAVTMAPWIGPSIQAGAILVSAFGVGCMIWANWAIARRRAIIDLIVTQQTDGDYLKARRNFVSLKKHLKINDFKGKGHVDDTNAADIRFILNMYEAVAIGIKKKAALGSKRTKMGAHSSFSSGRSITSCRAVTE